MSSSVCDVEVLRSIFETQSVSFSVRLLAALVSIGLFAAVFEATRRRWLREEFTPIWLTGAGVTLVVAVWFDLLIAVTRLLGAWTPSATVFFLGLVFLVGVCLHYAVRLSALSTQVKALAQELALLRDAPRPDGS